MKPDTQQSESTLVDTNQVISNDPLEKITKFVEILMEIDRKQKEKEKQYDRHN